MKRSIKKVYSILAIPFVLALGAGLTGCGGSDSNSSTGVGGVGTSTGGMITGGSVQNADGSVSIAFSGQAVLASNSSLVAGRFPSVSNKCDQSTYTCAYYNSLGYTVWEGAEYLGKTVSNLSVGSSSAVGGYSTTLPEKSYGMYGDTSRITLAASSNAVSGVITLSAQFIQRELRGQAPVSMGIHVWGGTSNGYGGHAFLYNSSGVGSIFVF